MNYLGHNEFGLNHEYWHKPEKYDDKNNKLLVRAMDNVL